MSGVFGQRASLNQGEKMAEYAIDVRGETCPVPIIETRKILRKVNIGDIITITGDHEPSRKEIPMIVEAMGYELVSVDEQDDKSWKIKIGVTEGKKG